MRGKSTGEVRDEIVITYRMMAYVLAVAAMIGLLLVSHTSLPESFIYSLSLAIAYVAFMRFLLATSAKALHKVKIHRIYRKPVIEGEPLELRVKVFNPANIPILYAELSDHYPPLFALVEGLSKITATLPAKGTLEYHYSLNPRLGRHRFKGMEVVLRDPLGLFAYKTILPGSEEVVTVYPKQTPIPQKYLRGWVTASLGQTKSGIKGLGNEFMMLREYNYGDDYRLIDWKSTARTGKPYVKVFEKESSLYLVIVVDTSPAMMYGYLGKTMLEETARLVAGLINYLVMRGDWVGLVLRGDKIRVVKIGRGKSHIRRMIKAISDVNWSLNYPEVRLGDAVKEAINTLPKRTKALFMIFTTLDPNAYPADTLDKEMHDLLSVCKRLKSLRHSTVIVSPLPELYEMKEMRGIEAGLYIALTIGGIKAAKEYANILRKSGVEVIQVGPSTLMPRIIKFIENFRAVPS